MPRYIDADKFMKDIRQRAYLTDNIVERPIYAMTVLGIQQTVDEQPTVSPDEVRGVGEWIEKEVYNIENTTIEQMQSACCSVCGKYHTTPYLYYFSKYNYCPNCGARMKGSDD